MTWWHRSEPGQLIPTRVGPVLFRAFQARECLQRTRPSWRDKDAAAPPALPNSCKPAPSGTDTTACNAEGRQTGNAEWVALRGEDGAGARAPAPPTRYRSAKDAGLAVRADGCARVCGGYARASGENAPAETAAQVHGCAAALGSGMHQRQRPALQTTLHTRHTGPL